MALPLCLISQASLKSTSEPGIGVQSLANRKHTRVNSAFHANPTAKSFSLIAKAGKPINNQNTKPNSVICADCDGNGAVQCSQCKGSGVNSVDLFDGQFKAGDSCWLCGGRKEMLCGNCNGAGFIGGFLSTYDQ